MKRVYDYLTNEISLSKDDTIVVGISGGPDSMALLYIVNQVSKDIGFKVICCHVNHNLRRESPQEAVMVKKWCDDNNITFEMMKIEKYGDDNFHNEARNIRYKFFESIVKKYNCKYLMTAHHGDDLIETILMRIVRGSTLKGYGGFQQFVDMGYYKIVRPLIYVTKNELETFCEEHKIPYAIDQSNYKDKYTRNRYRKVVLPFLKSEDSNVHEKFLNFSKTLYEYSEFVDRQVEKSYNLVYNNDILDISKFSGLDKLIGENIIYRILEDTYHDDLMVINNRHVTLIYDLINSNKKNMYIYLPNNIKVIKEYNFLKISDDVQIDDTYDIELNDYVVLPNQKHIEKIDSIEDNGNDICRINSELIDLPLHVRTRKDGDKIDLNGMIGHKKVKDVFIDSKISSNERKLWPIVVDSKDRVIWIPGIKKSKFMMKKNEKYDTIYKYY